MSVNKVILIGNVGGDPEIKTMDNGNSVASFSLATSEKYKKQNGEQVENTEWHKIILWNGLAQIVEKYVQKGDKLYIEGKIVTRTWDDQDGNKKYSTEIIGRQMTMLGSKGQKSNNQEPIISTPSVGLEEPDDLPF